MGSTCCSSKVTSRSHSRYREGDDGDREEEDAEGFSQSQGSASSSSKRTARQKELILCDVELLNQSLVIEELERKKGKKLKQTRKQYQVHLIIQSLRSPSKVPSRFGAQIELLTSVELTAPSNTLEIGDQVFYKCPSLHKISFDPTFQRVTRIGHDFLAQCTCLFEIDLAPLANVTAIGDRFMEGCWLPPLPGTKTKQSNPEEGKKQPHPPSDSSPTTIKVTKKGPINWALAFSNLITCGSSFLNVQEHDHRHIIFLSSLVMVTTGGDKLLSSSTNAEKDKRFSIPVGFINGSCRSAVEELHIRGLHKLREISEGVDLITGFRDLRSLVIEEGLVSLTAIEGHFVTLCPKLTNVSISSLISLRRIGDDFLNRVRKLTVLELFGFHNVTEIGNSFLKGCGLLTSLDMSSFRSLTKIGHGFAKDCLEMVKIDLSGLENVTSIGDDFLANTLLLTQIDFSGLMNVAFIGSYFLSGSGVRNLDISMMKDLKTIGLDILLRSEYFNSVALGKNSHCLDRDDLERLQSFFTATAEEIHDRGSEERDYFVPVRASANDEVDSSSLLGVPTTGNFADADALTWASVDVEQGAGSEATHSMISSVKQSTHPVYIQQQQLNQQQWQNLPAPSTGGSSRDLLALRRGTVGSTASSGGGPQYQQSRSRGGSYSYSASLAEIPEISHSAMYNGLRVQQNNLALPDSPTFKRQHRDALDASYSSFDRGGVGSQVISGGGSGSSSVAVTASSPTMKRAALYDLASSALIADGGRTTSSLGGASPPLDDVDPAALQLPARVTATSRRVSTTSIGSGTLGGAPLRENSTESRNNTARATLRSRVNPHSSAHRRISFSKAGRAEFETKLHSFTRNPLTCRYGSSKDFNHESEIGENAVPADPPQRSPAVTVVVKAPTPSTTSPATTLALGDGGHHDLNLLLNDSVVDVLCYMLPLSTVLEGLGMVCAEVRRSSQRHLVRCALHLTSAVIVRDDFRSLSPQTKDFICERASACAFFRQSAAALFQETMRRIICSSAEAPLPFGSAATGRQTHLHCFPIEAPKLRRILEPLPSVQVISCDVIKKSGNSLLSASVLPTVLHMPMIKFERFDELRFHGEVRNRLAGTKTLNDDDHLYSFPPPGAYKNRDGELSVALSPMEELLWNSSSQFELAISGHRFNLVDPPAGNILRGKDHSDTTNLPPLKIPLGFGASNARLVLLILEEPEEWHEDATSFFAPAGHRQQKLSWSFSPKVGMPQTSSRLPIPATALSPSVSPLILHHPDSNASGERGIPSEIALDPPLAPSSPVAASETGSSSTLGVGIGPADTTPEYPPGAIVSIDDGFLADCVNLRSVILRALHFCTSIGDDFLSGCTHLSDLGSVEDWSYSFGRVQYLGGRFCSGTLLEEHHLHLDTLSDLKVITRLPLLCDLPQLQAFNVCGWPEIYRLKRGPLLSRCTALTSLTISGCKNLSACAGLVTECPMLHEVKASGLAKNLVTVGNGFLSNNQSLNHLRFVLPYLKHVTVIGNEFLAGCTSLAEADLSPLKNLRSIGSSAFRDCVGLSQVKLQGCRQLDSIGDGFCEGTFHLDHFSLKGGGQLKSVGSRFFADSHVRFLDLGNLSQLSYVGKDFLIGCEAELRTLDATFDDENVLPEDSGTSTTTTTTLVGGRSKKSQRLQKLRSLFGVKAVSLLQNIEVSGTFFDPNHRRQSILNQSVHDEAQKHSTSYQLRETQSNRSSRRTSTAVVFTDEDDLLNSSSKPLSRKTSGLSGGKLGILHPVPGVSSLSGGTGMTSDQPDPSAHKQASVSGDHESKGGSPVQPASNTNPGGSIGVMRQRVEQQQLVRAGRNKKKSPSLNSSITQENLGGSLTVFEPGNVETGEATPLSQSRTATPGDLGVVLNRSQSGTDLSQNPHSRPPSFRRAPSSTVVRAPKAQRW